MVRRAEGWPGCAAVEVPNARRATVALRAVLAELRDAGGEMAAPLGVATDGTPAAADIADWPHGLAAGATGAGKSVFVNAVLVSLLLRYSPRRLRLVLIDPKRVEFSLYRGLPHLARPIVVGTDEAVTALEDAVAEMHRRYAALERAGARKLSEYNALAPEDRRLPRLLVVIDEAQALMADKEMAAAVVAASKALAAMGRAAGVHMLYGTQYPLATVIPSALKANTPTRVALLVPSRVNSQVILDQDGAEALLGAGDMLVCVGGGAEVRRLQSAFVSEEEVRAVVAWWKGHADGGDDGGAAADDGAPPAPSPVPSAREGASRLLRALAGEVTAQADALAGAHIAFVRPGELVAVRRDHVERVLRRLDAEPGAVLDQWKAAGWIRCDGDRYTAQVRTPWSSRARMVLVVWDAVRPDDGR
jgi:DNA segregation ATPase FtsK/SpoIIIE-like protein